MTNSAQPVVFRDLAWFRREVQNKRDQRAGMLEAAAKLDRQVADLVAELRALADELDPPTEDTAVAWDGGATEPRTVTDESGVPASQRESLRAMRDKLRSMVNTALPQDAEPVLTAAEREAWQTAKHAAPESVEYEPDLKDGRLTLRPTGRSWPAACEMCGAGNGQPCQAVSE